MLRGYVHIGQALCLNGKATNNNPNELILKILQDGHVYVPQLMKLARDMPTNRLLDFMLNPRYSAVLFQTTMQCISAVHVKEGITRQAVVELTKRMNRDMKDIQAYSEKCDLAKPYGIADILRQNPLGESEEAQSFGVSSRILFAMIGNLSLSHEHSPERYKELLDILIQVEVKEHTPLFESTVQVEAEVRIENIGKRIEVLKNRLDEEVFAPVLGASPEPLNVLPLGSLVRM
jgi:hypothetical protein